MGWGHFLRFLIRSSKLKNINAMKTAHLISIGLFTAAIVLTIYAWLDRIRYSKRYNNNNKNVHEEGFENPADPLAVANIPESILNASPPTNPTDADAVKAHKTLLIYTSQNVANGIRFMTDLGNRFFVQPTTIRTDFSPATLMNNYVSPLQKV